jgi:hypothetical protein
LFSPGGAEAEAAPKSAARLAAEAAFVPAQFHTPQPTQAQVVVKRTRTAAPVEPAQAKFENPLVTQATGQGPRVFRVQAAATHLPSQSPPAVDPNPRLSASLPHGNHSTAQPATRSRRTALDKKPGLVLHVVHSIPQRPDPENEQPQWRVWAAELGRIGTVLDDIKRAQSLTFIDDSFATEWRRLSRVANALRLEMKTQLR